LRIKDVDFARNEITVRGGKGGKDRRTVLPRSLVDPSRRQIERARTNHRMDVVNGRAVDQSAVSTNKERDECRALTDVSASSR